METVWVFGDQLNRGIGAIIEASPSTNECCSWSRRRSFAVDIKIRDQWELLLGIGRGRPIRTSTPGDQRAIGTPRGALSPAASTSDSSHSSSSAA